MSEWYEITCNELKIKLLRVINVRTKQKDRIMENKTIYKFKDDYVIEYGYEQYASVIRSNCYSGYSKSQLINTGKTLADIVKFIESK